MVVDVSCGLEMNEIYLLSLVIQLRVGMNGARIKVKGNKNNHIGQLHVGQCFKDHQKTGSKEPENWFQRGVLKCHFAKTMKS